MTPQPPSGTFHPQVRITHGKSTAWVDEGIADLILAMWRAGVATALSCQENHPGVAWVEFPLGDFHRFLRAVLRYEEGEDALYQRILSRYEMVGGGDWRYTLTVEDVGMNHRIDGNERHESHSGVVRPFLFVGVRFPVADIPLLIERLS